jgi:release factor glutamine methyltransferase
MATAVTYGIGRMRGERVVTAGGVPVREAVARAERALAAAGVASPRPDAELLAAHVLGLPRGRLVAAPDLTPDQLARYEAMVSARGRRAPLQHLTGTAAFGRLELAVGPGVFVPRPETELLAQWAARVPAAGSLVVDLCSGAGALALAIAHARPDARVFAVESAPAALDWLRRNAAGRAAAGDRPVTVIAGDAADPAVLAELDGGVDLVVCNPPYVPAGTATPPEVAEHDPPGAVFAGPDGLAVIRPVLGRAAALLCPGGWLALEHDETQAGTVPRLLDPWFTRVSSHRDLAGRPRFVTGHRSHTPVRDGRLDLS